jgi:hypothetical protein
VPSVYCRTEQAAASQRKSASVEVSLDRRGAEDSDKRNALYTQKIIIKFYSIFVDAVPKT